MVGWSDGLKPHSEDTEKEAQQIGRFEKYKTQAVGKRTPVIFIRKSASRIQLTHTH